MSHGGGWLTLTGVPVSQANALLGASYELYHHTETKEQILRTLGYAIPAVLHAHVQSVAPTTYFGSPQTPRLTTRERSGEAAPGPGRPVSGELRETLSSRTGLITPPILRWLYNLSTYVPIAADRNALGVVGLHGDYPSPLDMATFMSLYRADVEDPTFDFVQIGGGNLQDIPNMEASVDIQYTGAIAYPTHIIYYSNAGTDIFMWLSYALSQHSVPPTISMSYGGFEQDFAEGYAKALCNLFAQLGLRGSSVIFSSGDTAVGRGDCKVNDGSGKVQFLPTFPSSCTHGVVSSLANSTCI